MTKIFTLISLLQIIGQSLARDYTTIIGGPTFSVNYNANNQAFMFNATVEENVDFIIAFGQNATLDQTDMVRFGSQGAGSVIDLYGTFNSSTTDLVNDYINITINTTDIVNSTNKLYMFSAARKANTSDVEKDTVISCGQPQSFMWYSATSQNFFIGNWDLDTNADCSVKDAPIPSSSAADVKTPTKGGIYLQATIITVAITSLFISI